MWQFKPDAVPSLFPNGKVNKLVSSNTEKPIKLRKIKVSLLNTYVSKKCKKEAFSYCNIENKRLT